MLQHLNLRPLILGGSGVDNSKKGLRVKALQTDVGQEFNFDESWIWVKSDFDVDD